MVIASPPPFAGVADATGTGVATEVLPPPHDTPPARTGPMARRNRKSPLIPTF
jgi:hypothetical protein